LRLAFEPKQILADRRALTPRRALDANGYTVKRLSNSDAIVAIRHDGARHVVVTGNDPQRVLSGERLEFSGEWQTEAGAGGLVRATKAPGATVTARFIGNQARVIGNVGPDGGLADVFLDDEKQLVHVDCWNPTPRERQVLFYRNGLPPGAHTIRLVARGSGNPYSQGALLRVRSVQYSAAEGVANFPSGTGPRTPQRMIFGYTGRDDYRDSAGHTWRPGTELVTRGAPQQDTVAAFWWTKPAQDEITGTPDPELYRYGVHHRDFWVNVTVGPGRYHARLKFAATRGLDTRKHCFDIRINGRRLVERLDVAATAGGPNRAVDLVFNDLTPTNGVIEIRLTAARTIDGDKVARGEAFLQALGIGPGRGGRGAQPVSAPPAPVTGNLLLNSGFEETTGGLVCSAVMVKPFGDWTAEFRGESQSYVWQEADYVRHPDWGLPEFHSGKGAIRTHTDAHGHTRIYQDVEAEPNMRYIASVWVRAADLYGKGFGQHTNDSAGLIIWELDKGGRPLRQHHKIEVKTAGPYQLLQHVFVTAGDTTAVRYILDTIIHCPYTEGYVTYDDCDLHALR
jgi:hypothetical protein